MRLQAFLYMQGLVLSPHNTPAPPKPSVGQRGRINVANLFPSNDDEFNNGFGNFITVATANLAALGLVAADMTAATAARTDLTTKITASTTARDAMKSATTAKATSRASANTLLRNLTKRIEGQPNVPPSLIAALGMTVRDTTPTRIEPSIPLDLVGYGSDFGFNTLKWNKNGNKAGTTYIIEARVGAATSFQYVGQSTKPSFVHSNQIPGVLVAYRVKATRSAGESLFSNVATVYDQLLEIAA